MNQLPIPVLKTVHTQVTNYGTEFCLSEYLVGANLIQLLFFPDGRGTLGQVSPDTAGAF